MKLQLQCIFLVHLVYTASTQVLKVKPDGGDRIISFDGPPKVSLVSRIIPHGYKTPPLEYDSRFNTIFVPKFRVQKRIDLNTMEELASKELFLQPFKAFQKTGVEDQQANFTAQFTSFGEFHENNKKPSKKLKGSLNVFRNSEYEKPRHNRHSQSEKRTEMDSEESLSYPKRIHQKKQLNYYKGLDAFLKAIQRLYNKESRQRKPRSEKKRGTNLDKLFENNPNIQEAFKTVNDMLEDATHQSEHMKVGRKPKLLLKKIEVYQNNKKQDDHKIMNNLLQALQSLDSEELQQIDQSSLIQNPENSSHNKKNHKMKPKVKKLVFKSLKTFNMDKDDLISNLHTGGILRLLENTLNDSSQSDNLNEVNSNEPLWDSTKGPIKEFQVTNDVNDQLNEPQKMIVYPVSGESSLELWKPLKVPKKKQSIPSINLKTLLKQLSQAEKRTEDKTESWLPITVPNKLTIMEILTKQMEKLKSDEQNLKSASNEIPLQPVKVFNLDANLKNTEEIPEAQKKESFILYPTNDKKLKIAVRNLADLLKVWKYIESKKYAVQPLLRERGTNNVELEVENTKAKKHPFNFPHYSIWNFWTYDKTLLQDGCPGEQIKVGNMCVWTPPHRK